MESKQIQTVFIQDKNGDLFCNDGKEDSKWEYVLSRKSGYFFTPEELKERDEKRDIEMHNYYLQETQRAKADADMYKRQLDNLMTPFWKEGTF